MADAGGIRNKYKKKRGSEDKTNSNAEKNSSKVITDEKELKEEFVDRVKNRKKKDGGKIESQTKTQITVIETEITTEGKKGNQSRISKTKSEANLSSNKGGKKKGAEMSISKTNEISTTGTQETKGGRGKSRDANNAGNSQGKTGQRITKTTEVTTTTTTTNQQTKSNRGGQRGGKTTEETTTTQQRVRGGNNPNNSKEKQSSQRITKTTETTTKTTTTTTNQQNQRVRGKPNNQPTSNADKSGQQPNQRGRGNPKDSNKPNNNKDKPSGQQNPGRRGQPSNNQNNSKQNLSITNAAQNNLAAQKSTPNLRAKSTNRNNNENPNNKLKDNKKNRPLSTSGQSPDGNTPSNVVRILIDQTGRIPKKEYVLNVRKLDRIQDDRRHKRTYNDSITGEDKPLTTNFNHNIFVVRNVTKDLRTVLDVEDPSTIKHRYDYNKFVPGISNTGTHSIDESGKIQKPERIVSPRKNDVIITEKKPHKLDYTQAETYYDGSRIPVPNESTDINSNNKLRSKNNPPSNNRNKPNEQQPRGRGNNPNPNESKSNRNKSTTGNKTTKDSKLEISTQNRTSNRNKSEASNRGKSSDASKKEVTSSRTKKESGSGNNKSTKETTKTEKTSTSRRTGAGGKVTEETTKVTKTTTTETKTTRTQSKSNRKKDDSGKTGDDGGNKTEEGNSVTRVKRVRRVKKESN